MCVSDHDSWSKQGCGVVSCKFTCIFTETTFCVMFVSSDVCWDMKCNECHGFSGAFDFIDYFSYTFQSPRLPVTPAMARQPKKGEVLMSFAGSPVINENGDIRTQAGKTAPSISKEPSILTNLQVIVIFLITVTLKDGFLERILTFCTSNLQRKRQAWVLVIFL